MILTVEQVRRIFYQYQLKTNCHNSVWKSGYSHSSWKKVSGSIPSKDTCYESFSNKWRSQILTKCACVEFVLVSTARNNILIGDAESGVIAFTMINGIYHLTRSKTIYVKRCLEGPLQSIVGLIQCSW